MYQHELKNCSPLIAARVYTPSISRMDISDLFCAFMTLQDLGIGFDRSLFQKPGTYKHTISDDVNPKRVSTTIKKK